MISAFVITYNSEKYLRRCLESLSFADEILVVDSKSTDRTLEIAKECGARIIEREFTNFSEKKNFAKNQCSNEWILNIDADEYIPPETADEIKNAVKSEKFDAYLIPFRTYFLKEEIKCGRHRNEYHIRLFRKNLSYGSESVHERITDSQRTGRLKNCIIHTPYESIEDIRKRATRNAELSSEDKAKQNILILLFSLLLNPGFRFFKEYILLLGFREKKIGFYLALYSTKEVFLKYLWGLTRKLNLYNPSRNF